MLSGCPAILASRLFCLLAPSIDLLLLCWLEGDMLAGSLEPASPTERLLLALGGHGEPAPARQLLLSLALGFRTSWHHVLKP